MAKAVVGDEISFQVAWIGTAMAQKIDPSANWLSRSFHVGCGKKLFNQDWIELKLEMIKIYMQCLKFNKNSMDKIYNEMAEQTKQTNKTKNSIMTETIIE